MVINHEGKMAVQNPGEEKCFSCTGFGAAIFGLQTVGGMILLSSVLFCYFLGQSLLKET